MCPMFKMFLVRQKYFYKILGGDYMFNIQKKYTGPGCYRFLDSQANTIYIGSAKNIHRRLFSQHFKKNGGHSHLSLDCYNSVCKIEIMKTTDYPEALALEQILIDRYIPKYNKRDKRKDLFNNSYKSDIKENWKLYYTFREFDFNKIELSKKQTRLSLVATYICFIAIIGGLLWTLF